MSDKTITPEMILNAYAHGLFPMAETVQDSAEQVYWYDPPMRGILPLESFHIPRSLRRDLVKNDYTITVNTAFQEVIEGCAKPAKGREETWINPTISAWFSDLHTLGFAHSIEYRDKDGLLQGGLYGLSIGGAFFGESMYSDISGASKIALCTLAAHLWANGFTLLDTQFTNPHLEQFGCIEIPQDDYKQRLALAVNNMDINFIKPLKRNKKNQKYIGKNVIKSYLNFLSSTA